MDITCCTLCPRKCKADRTVSAGYCGGGAHVRVARAALHDWEEPCISGAKGSGTVFFSGCCLKCCFCQNYPVSVGNFGREIPVSRLAEIFLELQEKGAHNINLVSAAHYVPWVLEALETVKDRLHIPVVYNSGGYERVETLKMLEGAVDIYLPDLKYIDKVKSKTYSQAEDYFEIASQAVLEMHRQAPKLVFDENGLLKKGLIIRHLVMPGGKEDSIAVMQWIAAHFPADSILVSCMSQYTPCYRSVEHPEINRRVYTLEYRRVLEVIDELDLHGYMQEKSSAKKEYTPDFDLTGI